MNDGNWCGIEIKLGTNQIDSVEKNLIEKRDSIRKENGKEPRVLVVICGMSNVAYKRSDGVNAIPITVIKTDLQKSQ